MSLIDISSALTSPEGILALSDEPGVFGAKKQAKAAFDLWSGAEQRTLAAHHAIPVPGGSGTGFLAHLIWNPDEATPDFDAIALAAQTSLPQKLIRENERAIWKARNKKQNTFFCWRQVSAQPLSQWFQERFGVTAFVTQLFDRTDLTQDVAIVAVSGGADNIWLLTSK